MSSLVKLLYQFSTMHLLEGVHPLQSGVFRLRHPDERRPGLLRDDAMARVTDDDELNLDLLNQTQSAKEAVAHQKKVFQLTRGNA